MRPGEVVEAFPGMEPGVEFLEPGDDHFVELGVELSVVYALRAFRLPVQVGASRPGVLVLDAAVEYMPVELGPNSPLLWARADAFDTKSQPGEDLVHEDDGGLLSVALVNLEYAKPGAIIGGAILVVRPRAKGYGRQELDVELNLVSRKRLLRSAVALFSSAVLHVLGQLVDGGNIEQPPNGASAEKDVVIAEKIHMDPGRAEVKGLPHVQDLLHHVPGGSPGRCVRSGRSIFPDVEFLRRSHRTRMVELQSDN